MEIRRMLVISTAHLPPHLLDTTDGDCSAFGAEVELYAKDDGYFMYVPSQDYLNEVCVRNVVEGAFDMHVLVIMLTVRALDCDYVMFDCDGPRLKGKLPIWEEN